MIRPAEFSEPWNPLKTFGICSSAFGRIASSKTFCQPSAMSSSDSESTCSDLTSASDAAGSPVIQDLDVTMIKLTKDSDVKYRTKEAASLNKNVQEDQDLQLHLHQEL